MSYQRATLGVVCSNCAAPGEAHLVLSTLFYRLPLFWWTDGEAIFCSNCISFEDALDSIYGDTLTPVPESCISDEDTEPDDKEAMR